MAFEPMLEKQEQHTLRVSSRSITCHWTEQSRIFETARFTDC